MLDSLSIRHSHSANAHRLAGPVSHMLDLKLPLLTHLMAVSKHPENFTRQVNKCLRESVRSMVQLLRL